MEGKEKDEELRGRQNDLCHRMPETLAPPLKLAHLYKNDFGTDSLCTIINVSL